MSVINSLRLAIRRAVISSQVSNAPAKTLVMGLRPMRKGGGTEDEGLAHESAWRALFCEPRFSRDEIRDALIHGIRESKSVSVIEACMEQLLVYPNRADVARAFLDVVSDTPSSDLNEFIWYYANKYFNSWTTPLPEDQTAGFLLQWERLNRLHPSKTKLFSKIRARLINGGPPLHPFDKDYFME